MRPRNKRGSLSHRGVGKTKNICYGPIGKADMRIRLFLGNRSLAQKPWADRLPALSKDGSIAFRRVSYRLHPGGQRHCAKASAFPLLLRKLNNEGNALG